MLLSNYDFPGNVRELQVMVQDAVARHKTGKLSTEVFRQIVGVRKEPADRPKTQRVYSGNDDVVFPERLPTMDRVEELLIKEALVRTGNNRTLAAELLGITRQTIHRKLRQMNVEE